MAPAEILVSGLSPAADGLRPYFFLLPNNQSNSISHHVFLRFLGGRGVGVGAGLDDGDGVIDGVPVGVGVLVGDELTDTRGVPVGVGVLVGVLLG